MGHRKGMKQGTSPTPADILVKIYSLIRARGSGPTTFSALILIIHMRVADRHWPIMLVCFWE